MRKFLLIGAVAAVALGALFLATTLTSSDGIAEADGNGAVVINDAGCRIPDGTGTSVDADSYHEVITQSQNGNTVLKCSVKGVANPTGQAVRFDFDSTGSPCTTNAGLTENWHSIVSASGNATLTCVFP